MKYEDITKKIIGCAMQVHGALVNGFQGGIYQRAPALEMEYADLVFEREKEIECITTKESRKSFNHANQGSDSVQNCRIRH